MNALRLTPEDENKVREILADVHASVRCEIGVAGSLAQRGLSKRIADALAPQRLHDVDLLLLETSDDSPETPELRKRFTVVKVGDGARWHYGLRHKRTGMWVDLFSPPYERRTATVVIDGTTYRSSTLESQMLHIAQYILHLKKTRYPIRKKWIDKVLFLRTLPEIDQRALQEEYAAQPDYFGSALPAMEPLPADASDYLALACRQKPTPRFKEILFLVWRRYFIRKDAVT